MQSIINLWLILFWVTWIFFFMNTTNLIKLFITSEIIWLVMYIYSLLLGINVDDLQLYAISFIVITIATVEFSIGFIIVIFFKKVFKTTNTMDILGNDWTIINKLNN